MKPKLKNKLDSFLKEATDQFDQSATDMVDSLPTDVKNELLPLLKNKNLNKYDAIIEFLLVLWIGGFSIQERK